MGTKVQSLPGYYSMRDLNEESSSCGWPLFYGNKALANGQYYQNHLPSAAADVCSAYDKDVVKQTMLEHEAIFKNQVFELHRLYRIQRDLMDEVKMIELRRNHRSVGTSFSPGPLSTQITSEDTKKWHTPSFPITRSSACDRPSTSGVEGIHSPFCSNKGINKQTCLFPSPNGSSSKDVEILESRPSKVRRKMFDLHLPADEYIDTDEGEKFSDENISGTTIPDRCCKDGKGNDVNLFCGNGEKTGSHEGTSRSEQSLRSRNGFADLNEPVQVEEINAAACIPPLNHNPYQGEAECSDPSAKQKSRFFGFPTEDLLNPHHAPLHNGYLKNDGSGKLWISSKETGQGKSSLNPIPQVLKREQSFFSSPTIQDALGKGSEPTSDYLSNRSKTGLWREKTVGGLDISQRNNAHLTDKHPESVVSSHSPGLFAISPSSDFAKSRSQSAREMASSSLNQKLMSVQIPPSPFLNASGALSRSSQLHQSNGILGDGWPLNINSKHNNPGFHCEASVQNGFNPRIAEHFNNGSVSYNKRSNLICNMTSGKDINLNVRLSNGLSNDLDTQSGLGIVDGEQKHREQLAVLPWLRSKTTCKNEAQNSGSGRRLTSGELSFLQVASLSSKDETGKGARENFMNNVTSSLCSNGPCMIEAGESSSKKKILGVPIFGMPLISAKDSPLLTSLPVSVPNPSDTGLVENNRKNLVLDINLPCDADVLEVDMDKQSVTETIVCNEGFSKMEANSRNQIDLNLSMSEDETIPTTIPTTNVKMKVVIDLEAPAVPETEDDAIPEEKQVESYSVSLLGPQVTVEQPQDEFMRYAAEAIVSMSSLCCNQVDDSTSSPSETPMIDPLSWFADVASSCVDDMQRKFDNSRGKTCEGKGGSSSKEIDYFESMTLQLEEIKEEDYMPKPLVPENFIVEEIGTASLPTRARKGPARRGRQRRDFQRDILPGLSSLSRHEVTEDLQTFGGLMKATGYAWTGLTRRSSSRNGCGRGRRRSQVPPSSPPPVATIETCTLLMQQLNNVEVGLEDRSLTGWGKTTRRPRRQRCPASIRLT
ncbi:uncharacterized protein LOC123906968 [Trifolium pratense]|uniref:uncharacterized protein LOC123906968 n=1 Tax=Trifolium pratense TaxID=57577 RepID=UPI001E69795F|nr:uncharacterized protein LOC123906968 [Trifolium pratense]XP_045812959.1 uncharacterized protein LOC123906968 [Trifolium pratense]